METKELYSAIAALVRHGRVTGLIEEEDKVFVTNMILEKLKLDSYEEPEEKDILSFGQKDDAAAGCYLSLERILKVLTDYAAETGLVDGESTVCRDLYDTSLMSCLTMRPSEVIKRFNELYNKDAGEATDWYYSFSRATDYIRTYRVARDIKWTSPTEYGDMIVTINLSKPEKDPKAIAAALSAKQSAYPKCQLCKENEGYAGRINHPARQNHRIIPITINKTPWFLQYSPYVYYNEHCIVFNSEHTPMKIDRAAFDKLLDFIGQFPHYMVGSNADLPIVGGSILTHDHFQGGRFEFPMAKAETEQKIDLKGFDDIRAGIVKWPMTVLRLKGANPERISACADKILGAWREYTDESSFVFAYTDGTPHNTITPIARRRGTDYELDLVLRNNITTDEHPLGVYHPHAEYHHIKKENIGLIEVMGLAILPARLKTELAALQTAMLEGRDIRNDEVLAKHADWVDEIRGKYTKSELSDADSLKQIIRDEVGLVYSKILEQCAVFKRDSDGRAALLRFIDYVNTL